MAGKKGRPFNIQVVIKMMFKNIIFLIRFGNNTGCLLILPQKLKLVETDDELARKMGSSRLCKLPLSFLWLIYFWLIKHKTKSSHIPTTTWWQKGLPLFLMPWVVWLLTGQLNGVRSENITTILNRRTDEHIRIFQ